MDGWEDVADDALNWAIEHSRAAAPQPVEEASEKAATSPT